MANRPATGISNWKLVETHVDGCKCPRDDGSGVSDRCSEATCGSKCWSQPGANGSTKYQCTKIGYKPSGMMSADDVSRPTTIAAFADQSDFPSPKFDAFEGGKFDPYDYAGPASGYTINFGVDGSFCYCHPNRGCDNCNAGKTCWSIQETIRTNDGKPGTLTSLQYFCADTQAQLVAYYNQSKSKRPRGTRNLFDNFPTGHQR